jgi:cytochrome c553
MKGEDMRRSTIVIAVLTGFLAVSANAGGNAATGKEKSQVCAACHGPDGNSANPDFPRLAGQYADYLERALLDYQSGARKNAIMKSQVENLSRQDIEDLAAYYAGQKGLHGKY